MKEEFRGIQPHEIVTVTQMKHITEIQYLEKMNTSCNIRKLDKDRYMRLDTGEILEYNHIDTRDESYNSLRQTFKKIRNLINNNFEGTGNELHVTLTYAENVTDPKRLYMDFKKFLKRLRYVYDSTTSIDYMSVVEPQERGAWHCHVLLRFNDLERVYIANNVNRKTGESIDAPLRDMWGQGNVTIHSLKGVDNIGAYLSAYLSDVELNADTALTAAVENREIMTKTVNGTEKRFIKGGRLHMYPAGMNLYRKSKGIEHPARPKMTYEKAKKIVGSGKPHYEKTFRIETEDFENTIHFEQYNTRRLQTPE